MKIIKEQKMTYSVKGTPVTFLEKILIDDSTGEEIFDPNLEQENDINLYNGVPSGKRGITTLRIFLTIDAPFIFNVFRPFFIQKFSQVI